MATRIPQQEASQAMRTGRVAVGQAKSTEAARAPGVERLMRLQAMAAGSPAVQRLMALQAGQGPAGRPVQRAVDEEEPLQGKLIQRAEEEEEPLQGKLIQRAEEEEEPLQGKLIQREEQQDRAQAGPSEGHSDLPAQLRAGIEGLSGVSMAGVNVHRNSDAPARVGAHAFAQGRDIHLAPGQEQHLPHEAWHVVQQAQGRVQPTIEVNGAAVNDDAGLESEADVMGKKAQSVQMVQAQTGSQGYGAIRPPLGPPTSEMQLLAGAIPAVSRVQRSAARSPMLNGRGYSVALHAGAVFQRMPRPDLAPIVNQKLRNYILTLFKQAPANGQRIGDGSAMAAAHHELTGGEKVGGRDHVKKVNDILLGLTKLLDRDENPRSPFSLSDEDYEVAVMLENACTAAVEGNYDSQGDYWE